MKEEIKNLVIRTQYGEGAKYVGYNDMVRRDEGKERYGRRIGIILKKLRTK